MKSPQHRMAVTRVAGSFLLIVATLHLGTLCRGQGTQVQPLYDQDTKLEPAITEWTAEALITRIGDRVRDRHAREAQFQAYNHYLSFYWEQRSIGLEFIDKVARGGSDVTIHIESMVPLNEPNFRAFFRGLNTVAEYHENMVATEVAPNRYKVTLEQHPIDKRPLKIGDAIEFEFSPFLAAPDHGRSNYYGTTMLYVVGKGIVPWMGVGERLDSVPLPSSVMLGGGATLSYQYSEEPAERFKQMAGNISPTSAQPFLLGRRLHHTNMLDGTHSEQPNPTFRKHAGKLGPKYVATSCIACHINNGRALPQEVGQDLQRSVVKVGADDQAIPHPILGSALQTHSVNGAAEGGVKLARYEMIVGKFADGESFELRKPIYAFDGVQPKNFSVRITPHLVGLGLLEAISEQDVLARSDPDDQDGDGISGRPQIIVELATGKKRLGRFGYKAGQPSLRHQIANAFNSDMGVTTTVAPLLDGADVAGPIEVEDDELSHLVRYVSLLGVNAQRSFSDPETQRGRELFKRARCTACHTESFTTSSFHPFAELRGQAIQPFTDLLLHDMGAGLADDLGELDATGREWRTSPLWGIGHTEGVSGGKAFLHDGRARNLQEAILWHGGEAESSKEAFRKMPSEDRKSLIRFLQSL